MTATAHAKSALSGFLDEIGALVAAGNYAEVSERYKAFVTAHPTSRFLASEPIPTKVALKITGDVGSSAFTTFTLKRPTWASDLRKVADDPAAFASAVHRIESEAAAYTNGKG